MPCAEIAHLREVERHRLIDILVAADIFFAVYFKCPFDPRAVLFTTAVIDNNDFIRRGLGVFLNGLDAVQKHLRIILAGNNNADEPLRSGFVAETPCQGAADQIAVPGGQLSGRVKQNFRNMADRESSGVSSGKAAVGLRDFQAQAPVDPGAHALVQFR